MKQDAQNELEAEIRKLRAENAKLAYERDAWLEQLLQFQERHELSPDSKRAA